MARRPASRPAPLPVSAPQTREQNRYPERLTTFAPGEVHDENTCPTCAPIVNSPAYRRGIAAARADLKELTNP